MLYDDVLEAAQAGTLSAELMDSRIVEACLEFAERVDAQAVADFAAAESTREDWRGAAIPAMCPPVGIYWLEWAIPKAASAQGAGHPVGVLVETVAADLGPGDLPGTCLRAAGFMDRTLMLYAEISFAPLGSPTPENLLDVVHDGRIQFLIHQNTPVSHVRDDLYNSTFAWLFLVPTLLHFIGLGVGGIEKIPSGAGLGNGRTLPQALGAYCPRARLLDTPASSSPVSLTR